MPEQTCHLDEVSLVHKAGNAILQGRVPNTPIYSLTTSFSKAKFSIFFLLKTQKRQCRRWPRTVHDRSWSSHGTGNCKTYWCPLRLKKFYKLQNPIKNLHTPKGISQTLPAEAPDISEWPTSEALSAETRRNSGEKIEMKAMNRQFKSRNREAGQGQMAL